MNEKSVDQLNIFLIIASLFLAISIPFKLFVFSYVVLGPLHYLTEINWLRKKKYFVSQTSFIPFLIFLGGCMTVYPIFKQFNLLQYSWTNSMAVFVGNNVTLIISIAFLLSIFMVVNWSKNKVIVATVLAIFACVLINFYLPQLFVPVGILLPTIIHVFIFTGLFMYYGALKNNSRIGKINVVLLILCPVLIALIKINPNDYFVSDAVGKAHVATKMLDINVYLAKLLGVPGQLNILSSIGIKIQIFVAFAYTYHYLNWFSKTSVIGWKDSLNSRSSLFILGIWSLVLIAAYFSYSSARVTLLFLSFMHVILEFPLNIQSIKGVAKSFRS